MTEPITSLLERLAATAPAPSGDPVDQIGRRLTERHPRGRLMPLAVGVATLIVVLVPVAVVNLQKAPAARPAPAAAPRPVPGSGSAATSAASRFATLLLSADYRTWDRQIAGAAALAAGPLQAEIIAAGKTGKAAAVTSRTVTVAHVLAAAAEQVTDTSATVLIAPDVSTTSAQSPTAQLDRLRLRLTMQRTGGQWLATGRQLLPGGQSTHCADPTAAPETQALLQQACAAATLFQTYDYRQLDADAAAADAVTTGQARSDLRGMYTQEHQALLDGHVVMRASIADAAVVQQNPTSATVLAFTDVTVRNVVTTSGLNVYRLELHLQKVAGRWLLADVKPIM